jgi:uncharacterized protein YeaO (DUF488 family)
MSIAVKRVYEPPAKSDGARVLVDRLWPRGIKKEDAALDEWTKEVGPSSALRQWFGHEPDKWKEFQRRYRAELDASPGAWQPLLARARKGRLTLLFGSREERYNNAVALKAYLEAKLGDAA